MPCENQAIVEIRGMSAVGRATGVLALAGLIAGCAFGAGAGAPVGVPDWPCDATTDFAFTGETSLAALGIDEFGGGREAARVGTVWVTADPVSMDPPDIPAANRAPPARVVCVRWADGSGMAGPIDNDWQPPGGLLSATSESANPPLTLLAVVGAAVVVVAVSVLAFRERRA